MGRRDWGGNSSRGGLWGSRRGSHAGRRSVAGPKRRGAHNSARGRPAHGIQQRSSAGGCGGTRVHTHSRQRPGVCLGMESDVPAPQALPGILVAGLQQASQAAMPCHGPCAGSSMRPPRFPRVVRGRQSPVLHELLHSALDCCRGAAVQASRTHQHQQQRHQKHTANAEYKPLPLVFLIAATLKKHCARGKLPTQTVTESFRQLPLAVTKLGTPSAGQPRREREPASAALNDQAKLAPAACSPP
jgi:hypothetical protein